MPDNKFPVPTETVEAGLLAAIEQDLERYLAIGKAGIKAEDFVAHRQVYLFFQNYLEQYNALPSNSQLAAHFQWQPPVGDYAYWLTEMKRYVMAQKVLQAVQEVYNLAAEPEKALSLALERFSLMRAANNSHVQATDSAAQERYEKYLARQQYIFATEQVLGLRTGLAIIDGTRQGWMPGELIGMYARPGVGKTWWLVWLGGHVWMQGGTVLSITPEVPASQLNLRIDVILGQMLGLPLEYNKVLAGDPSIQENYHKVTDVLSASKRWWTYDSLDGSGIGLGDLSALIRLHQPDIVLVDGVSLLRYEGRGQTWEMMREQSYGLKTLATITEKPIIVSHQPTNSARGIRTEVSMLNRGDDFHMPTLNDAAYGDAFVQACSTVITMAPDKDARYVQWYSIRKARERGWQQALPARMGLAWDPGNGLIIDLGRYGYQPELVGQEALRLLGFDKLR